MTETKSSVEDIDADHSKMPRGREGLFEHVEVTCEAVIGAAQTTIGDLNRMNKGDILNLDRSPADPVDICIDGIRIARGQLVSVDGKFGIRVTEID